MIPIQSQPIGLGSGLELSKPSVSFPYQKHPSILTTINDVYDDFKVFTILIQTHDEELFSHKKEPIAFYFSGT